MPPPRTADPRLAAILRQARIERGQTQEDLAYEADLVATTIARVEGGRVDPSWTTVCTIAEALGLPLDELGRLIEVEGRRA